MKKPVCSRCGSDAVLLDAYAEWDMEKQDWVLQNVFQDAICEDCEGEASLDWVDVTPEASDSLACTGAV